MIRTESEDDLLIVSAPVNKAGLVRMRDLRDLLEATADAPEDVYVRVLDDEIRYEVGLYGGAS